MRQITNGYSFYAILKNVKILAKFPFFFIKRTFEYIYLKRKCIRLKTSKNKTNILCIVPHMVVGGAEKVILNIAKSVDRSKFSFHIISTVVNNNDWAGKFQEHFHNVIIPTMEIGDDNRFKNYFLEIINKLEIDILLISNSERGYQFLPDIKNQFKEIKVIDLVHAVEAVGGLSGLLSRTPYISKRVCISSQAKKHLINAYNFKEFNNIYNERLEVIFNGIDIIQYSSPSVTSGKFRSKYNIPHNYNIISFIGRFSEEKNPLLFIEVAFNVISSLPGECNVKFVMAGDGPEYESIKKKIRNKNIDEYFILTGMIDNIDELLKDTYILLVTSKCEGIPLVISEAMAMKIPVLSTNVGAVCELVEDKVNGYIIDPDDKIIQSFTSRIIHLLSETIERSVMGEKGRDTIVRGYSLEIMGAKYENLFEELLSNNRIQETTRTCSVRK